MTPGTLAEHVALAMAAAEGNREAQERAIGNNWDALGYGALAKAAVAELERLGVLAGAAATNAATGAAEEPRADFVPIPCRGVTAT